MQIGRKRAIKELVQAAQLVVGLMKHQLAADDTLSDDKRKELEMDVRRLEASIKTMSLSSNG